MKRNFVFMIALLMACSTEEKKIEPVETTHDIQSEDAAKIIYEGVVKTEYGEGPIELSLSEAETGLSSTFELRGDLASDQMWSYFRGSYTTLPGAANAEIIFQLHGKFTAGIVRSKDGKPAGRPEVRDVDLYFISEGVNKLVLVDEDYNRIAEDGRYTLYKRSRLFTAEGYLTFEETRTEFFEQNTSERWNVAPLGVYSAAQRTYDSLASEKFEGIYLKALAYSVESDSSDQDLLVIKKILEIKKSHAFDNDKLIR